MMMVTRPKPRAGVRRPRAAAAALVALVAVVAFAVAACTAPAPEAATSSATAQVLERKNVKDLTSEEKADFVAAVKKLKSIPAPADSRVSNWYDHFVITHISKLVCWGQPPNQGGYGHLGPTLLTWHRAFLQEFEQALGEVAGKPIAIPYWDWTDPASTEAVFADDFMGPGGKPENDYVVTEGPFRQGEWTIEAKGFPSTNPGQFDSLVRAIGTIEGATELPTTEEVQQSLLRPVYDTVPWNSSADPDQSFRQYVDSGESSNGITCGDDGLVRQDGLLPGNPRMHATVHMWVGGQNAEGQGGSLKDCVSSPNDPIFWLHHANLDRIAEAWWSTHDYEYLPETGGPVGDNVDDTVYPYTATNGEMASPSASLGYVYSALPTVSGVDELQAVPEAQAGALRITPHH
jgi:tyrosinase